MSSKFTRKVYLLLTWNELVYVYIVMDERPILYFVMPYEIRLGHVL